MPGNLVDDLAAQIEGALAELAGLLDDEDNGLGRAQQVRSTLTAVTAEVGAAGLEPVVLLEPSVPFLGPVTVPIASPRAARIAELRSLIASLTARLVAARQQPAP